MGQLRHQPSPHWSGTAGGGSAAPPPALPGAASAIDAFGDSAARDRTSADGQEPLRRLQARPPASVSDEPSSPSGRGRVPLYLTRAPRSAQPTRRPTSLCSPATWSRTSSPPRRQAAGPARPDLPQRAQAAHGALLDLVPGCHGQPVTAMIAVQISSPSPGWHQWGGSSVSVCS